MKISFIHFFQHLQLGFCIVYQWLRKKKKKKKKNRERESERKWERERGRRKRRRRVPADPQRDKNIQTPHIGLGLIAPKAGARSSISPNFAWS